MLQALSSHGPKQGYPFIILNLFRSIIDHIQQIVLYISGKTIENLNYLRVYT